MLSGTAASMGGHGAQYVYWAPQQATSESRLAKFVAACQKGRFSRLQVEAGVASHVGPR